METLVAVALVARTPAGDLAQVPVCAQCADGLARGQVPHTRMTRLSDGLAPWFAGPGHGRLLDLGIQDDWVRQVIAGFGLDDIPSAAGTSQRVMVSDRVWTSVTRTEHVSWTSGPRPMHIRTTDPEDQAG